eukprot:scaffold84902_cov63-Phaeocystis_antarctica.AAC.5
MQWTSLLCISSPKLVAKVPKLVRRARDLSGALARGIGCHPTNLCTITLAGSTIMLRVTLFSAVLAAASATRLESLRLRGGQQACTIYGEGEGVHHWLWKLGLGDRQDCRPQRAGSRPVRGRGHHVGLPGERRRQEPDRHYQQRARERQVPAGAPARLPGTPGGARGARGYPSPLTRWALRWAGRQVHGQRGRRPRPDERGSGCHPAHLCAASPGDVDASLPPGPGCPAHLCGGTCLHLLCLTDALAAAPSRSSRCATAPWAPPHGTAQHRIAPHSVHSVTGGLRRVCVSGHRVRERRPRAHLQPHQGEHERHGRLRPHGRQRRQRRCARTGLGGVRGR